jgi:hypothetical protein
MLIGVFSKVDKVDLLQTAKKLQNILASTRVLPAPYPGQRVILKDGKISGLNHESIQVKTAGYNGVTWLPSLEELACIAERLHITLHMADTDRVVWQYKTMQVGYMNTKYVEPNPIYSVIEFKLTDMISAYEQMYGLISRAQKLTIDRSEVIFVLEQSQEQPIKNVVIVERIRRNRGIIPDMPMAALRSRINIILNELKDDIVSKARGGAWKLKCENRDEEQKDDATETLNNDEIVQDDGEQDEF